MVQDTHRWMSRGLAGRPRLAYATTLLVALLSVGWMAYLGYSPRAEDRLSQQYYYDLNSGRLLVRPAQTPPIMTNTGALRQAQTLSRQERVLRIEAGVLAHVFSCGSCDSGSPQRFIGWIEDVPPPSEPVPLGQRLVAQPDRYRHCIREPNGQQWVSPEEPQGRRIIRKALKRCPGELVRCLPDGPVQVGVSLGKPDS
jgi:hypothetical protein